MNEFLAVLSAVLPVVCMAAVGVAMRLLDWLTEAADASLLRVTINLLVPCLILDSMLGNRALENPQNIFVPPLIGFSTVILGLAAAGVVQRWTGLVGQSARRTFVFATAFYNYGYIPLPLALLLFDRETAAVLFVHNVGAEVAIWTVGLAVLRGEGIGANVGKLINPPLVAILAALALNFSGLETVLPSALLSLGQVMMTAVKMLGQCAIPMGLVLIGATIADHRREIHPARSGRVMSLACVLRLGILPVLFLLLAKFLPLSLELTRVVVLEAAMPSAGLPIVMAKHFGGDTSTAIRIVAATMVLGLVTIPLWLQFGLSFVGL